MAVAYSIKEKVTEYFNDIPDLKGQEPSKLLIDFVIEKYKQQRNFPSNFTENQIEDDIQRHISTIAMAVVDLKMKEGAEGESSHSENSISRSYENAYISSSIFNDVLPYVHFL